MTTPTVTVEDLRKTFDAAGAGAGRVTALDGLTLVARAGQLTALVGPDGAGKTTLMRIFAGLLRPDSGKICVLGIDVALDPQAVQARIGYMPQRFGLYEDLSVQENLDLYADLHGVPMAERASRFARMLDLTDMARFTGRPAGKLSGGMKQKLGLACTLVRAPDLLLLDEPTVGVDPLSRRDLWAIVQQLVRDEGLSVIVSTAYLDEAERCTQVFVMDRGRLLAEGTPNALKTRAKGLTYTAMPPADLPARDLQARLIDAPRLIVDAVPMAGNVRFIRQPDAEAAGLQDLLAGAPAEPRGEDLEDAFMMLLHQREAVAGPGPIPPDTGLAPDTSLAPATGPAPAGGQAGQPAIVVRDLVRKFGDFTAVASTSFEVARGEIFGLLGPNGAGKTTTFRMLCGLLPATAARFWWPGTTCAAQGHRHADASAMSRRSSRSTARYRCARTLNSSAGPMVCVARCCGRGSAMRSNASTLIPRRKAASCPRAIGSGWRWRRACCTSPRSCFSTSLPAASTRWPAAPSGAPSPRWPMAASPSS
jgi:ABC-2 type transport system ATP-binding protein